MLGTPGRVNGEVASCGEIVSSWRTKVRRESLERLGGVKVDSRRRPSQFSKRIPLPGWQQLLDRFTGRYSYRHMKLTVTKGGRREH